MGNGELDVDSLSVKIAVILSSPKVVTKDLLPAGNLPSFGRVTIPLKPTHCSGLVRLQRLV
jgi:hypothetical protein